MFYVYLGRAMGMTSTTGYDIWSEDNSKIPNYPRSTYEGHFKPHSDYPTSTYRGRHLKPHSDNLTSTYRGRHRGGGGRLFKLPYLEIDNPIESFNKATQQTPNEEDEVRFLSSCKRHKQTYPYGVYSWPYTNTARI